MGAFGSLNSLQLLCLDLPRSASQVTRAKSPYEFIEQRFTAFRPYPRNRGAHLSRLCCISTVTFTECPHSVHSANIISKLATTGTSASARALSQALTSGFSMAVKGSAAETNAMQALLSTSGAKGIALLICFLVARPASAKSAISASLRFASFFDYRLHIA